MLERLRPRLKVFTDENSRELFDLPDAPRPDPEVPVPPRFIAEFDNLLLSHADRTRVLTPEARKQVFGAPNGVFPGTFLVDGFVRGSWKIRERGAEAALEVLPFQRISTKDRDELQRLGLQLLEFTAPGNAGGVRFSELAQSGR